MKEGSESTETQNQKSQYLELLERIESARGPDREIDAEIAVAQANATMEARRSTKQ